MFLRDKKGKRVLEGEKHPHEKIKAFLRQCESCIGHQGSCRPLLTHFPPMDSQVMQTDLDSQQSGKPGPSQIRRPSARPEGLYEQVDQLQEWMENEVVCAGRWCAQLLCVSSFHRRNGTHQLILQTVKEKTNPSLAAAPSRWLSRSSPRPMITRASNSTPKSRLRCPRLSASRRTAVRLLDGSKRSE